MYIIQCTYVDCTCHRYVFHTLSQAWGMAEPAGHKTFSDGQRCPKVGLRQWIWNNWLLKTILQNNKEKTKQNPNSTHPSSLIEVTRPTPKKSKSGAGNYTWVAFSGNRCLHNFVSILKNEHNDKIGRLCLIFFSLKEHFQDGLGGLPWPHNTQWIYRCVIMIITLHHTWLPWSYNALFNSLLSLLLEEIYWNIFGIYLEYIWNTFGIY